MNGVMRVVARGDAALAAPETVVASDAPSGNPPRAAPARAFVHHWRRADFPTRLPQPDAEAAVRGRAVLEAASCLLCHALGGDGGRTGPPLAELAARHERDALLTEVLEPSRAVLDGYASTIFFLHDGRVVAGRVLSEDTRAAHVQTDPYRDETMAIAHDDIAERRVSEVSTMPDGLLSTFTREQILDLLAFLESLRPASAARGGQ
jgi:putative heme-binding domain-containing protein